MRLCQVALFMLWAILTSAQTITHEEQVVRTTYAKLSFADEVRIIMKTMDTVPNKWNADEYAADKALNSRLDFQLSKFTTGPIKDIEGRITSEISGEPNEGDTTGVLKATPGTFNYRDDSATGKAGSGSTEWALYADVAWDTHPYRRFPASGWPMAAILDLPEMNGPYDRYATYSVTVTFQSKSRTYNSAVLFGKNPDGSEKVHFLDSITQIMTLDLLAKTEMSTAPFTKTHLRSVPFVRKWLNDNRQSCGVKGHGDVCCNTDTNKCGIGTSPISRRLQNNGNPYLVMAGFHPSAPSGIHGFFQTSCSSFNSAPVYNHGGGDTTGHTTGQHTFTSAIVASCSYTTPPGSTGPGTCNVACKAEGTSTMEDFGSLSGLIPGFHVTGVGNKTGQAGGAPSESCQGTSAGSVLSCLTPGCGVTVTINGTADGVGATIAFANGSIWNDQNLAKQDCPAESTAPTPTPTPLPPPPVGSKPGQPCDNDPTGGGTGGDKPDLVSGCSPIVIDLTGEGFALTDVSHGVLFDIANTGVPIQIAWTANANNAFLVLDRDGSGTITSGAELFGNFTSQPSSPHPNGFLALAVYDDPANGGNGDGIIDSRDQIFSKLRLWVDANHDGVCQPGELHPLPDLGVYAISLDYTESGRTDQFGNVFRYSARINPGISGKDNDVGKKAYDVFLMSQ